MQDHSTDQLHVEVPHVQNPTTCLAYNRECLFENFVQHFLQSVVLRFLSALDALRIGLVIGPTGSCARLGSVACGETAESICYFLAELVGLGAQLFIREPLHLGLKRGNCSHTGQQALDFTLVLGAKNLT